MVGAGRFELPTPGPPDRCANRAALRSEAKPFEQIGYTRSGCRNKQRAQTCLSLFLGGNQDAAADLDLIDQSTERTHIDLPWEALAIAQQARNTALRGLGGNIGDLVELGHGVFLILFLSDPPEIHHMAGTVLAQDLLYASNGVAIVIKKEADATQKSDVFRPVVTPPASPLHRL